MINFKELITNNKDDIIKPVVVLLAICIIIPLALSLTNKVTVSRIAELEEKNNNETMSRLVKAEEFKKSDFKDNDTEFSYHIAIEGSKTVGYVFKTSAKGYGGEVTVMTAVDTNGEIKRVAIIDVTSETPGLGQNANKESFYSQYEGKNGETSIVKNGADGSNDEIDAITGATITSRAVNNAVNTALQNYRLAVSAENFNTQEAEGSENEK